MFQQNQFNYANYNKKVPTMNKVTHAHNVIILWRLSYTNL